MEVKNHNILLLFENYSSKMHIQLTFTSRNGYCKVNEWIAHCSFENLQIRLCATTTPFIDVHVGFFESIFILGVNNMCFS